MQVDPRFKKAKRKSTTRKIKRSAGPWLIGGASVGVVLVVGFLIVRALLSIEWGGDDDGQELAEDEFSDEEQLVITDFAEDAVSAADPLAFTQAFVDVAGDPMILQFDRAAETKAQELVSHPDLPATRIGLFAVNGLVLVQDDMITQEERLITTIPSSREDFAFFQAQSDATGLDPQQALLEALPDTPAQTPATTVQSDEGSWGESLDGGGETVEVTYTETVIENTTSLALVLPEPVRIVGYEDVFLRLAVKRELAEILETNGFDPVWIERFAPKAIEAIPAFGAIEADHVLAVRGVPERDGLKPVQASLYKSDEYLGSVAINDDGHVVVAADPWVPDDLFDYAEGSEDAQAVSTRRYRLLDAFYSAAIRNNVPTAVVAEAIILMSQAHDLDEFATQGDRMTLLYARAPGPNGQGAGQILYASIDGPSGEKLCYVVQPKAGQGYECRDKSAPKGGGGGGTGSLRGGFVTPVSGVLTSPFGPRNHPILKRVVLHKGVDWAAPSGTPIVAAFDGTVKYAGDGGGYGNVIYITHPGNRETRYAHMSKFSPLGKAGTAVRAGDVIGFVGTTGRSTGPHLHFEIYENGTAVDPFSAAGPVIASNSSQAVEQLVNKIIKVESAGNARAKNPLSSATGLGQFISSTWIRMMKTYRPDLYNSMSRADLLALRFDPTLSREMVANLAKEGEAYLRARGHAISAGRLYLAHFLGAEGAHVALSKPDGMLVLDAMGGGVVNANPFLRGRNIAWLKAWADRKMRTKGIPAAPVLPSVPVAAPTPPHILAYFRAIDTVLESSG